MTCPIKTSSLGWTKKQMLINFSIFCPGPLAWPQFFTNLMPKKVRDEVEEDEEPVFVTGRNGKLESIYADEVVVNYPLPAGGLPEQQIIKILKKNTMQRN
jgi:hypothetical protein